VRNFRGGWQDWLANFEGESLSFDHLLPFADFGTGDYYCFDLRAATPDGEMPVVHWSHETGETEFRSPTFGDFAEAVLRGDFDCD
jgi:hypothetical protein